MMMTPPHTPTRSSRRSEADTVKKSRFFHAIDARKGKSIKEVCEEENINHHTGKYWLHLRKLLSSPASRRTGKNRSGRPHKLSAETLNKMLKPENPVRDQPYECQIDYFRLGVCKRTLQYAFKMRPTKADRYKMKTVKAISIANKRKRVDYAHRHKNESISSF